MVLLSTTRFVCLAYTSSGIFIYQLRVPVYLKTNCVLHRTQNTYEFAYRNCKPPDSNSRKQARGEIFCKVCHICNVLGPTALAKT